MAKGRNRNNIGYEGLVTKRQQVAQAYMLQAALQAVQAFGLSYFSKLSVRCLSRGKVAFLWHYLD